MGNLPSTTQPKKYTVTDAANPFNGGKVVNPFTPDDPLAWELNKMLAEVIQTALVYGYLREGEAAGRDPFPGWNPPEGREADLERFREFVTEEIEEIEAWLDEHEHTIEVQP